MLTTRLLLALFVAFRLAALALYRPGGLLDVAPPYQGLPALGLDDPLLRQWAWGLLLLPFDAATLWLLRALAAQHEPDEGAAWRAALWAASPLPLWVWLTSATPAVTFLLLLALWGLRLARRSWLWAALPLAVATLVQGPDAGLTALLLPFVLLLVPRPAATGALFTVGALLAGPVAARLSVAETLFQVGYVLALAPALAEWLWLLRPVPGWPAWRARMLGGSALASGLVLALALFVVAPRALRPARLAASPLAPALREMQAAPGGWLLTDSVDLWEQAVGLGTGEVAARVVSPRNRDDLRARLETAPTAVWLLQSPGERAPEVVEPLVEGWFPAEEETLPGGARLRRFVSASDVPLAPVGATFEDGVMLEAARVPASAEIGGLLPVELRWRGDPGDETLFLHLVDASGSTVSQRDVPPGPTPDRHALRLPATLPPGRYTLLAGRYNPTTGQRVALQTGGDALWLGEIDLTDSR